MPRVPVVGNTAMPLFFPTDFVLFPSALIRAIDEIVSPAEYALYHLPCDYYVVVYVCK